MFFDQALLFSSNQAITTTANATNLIDVTGAGSGNAPTMIGGNGGVIGADWGAGDGEAIPYVVLFVTTAGTTSNTLTVTLQAAPDNGSNVAGTYTVLYQSPAITGTSLVKGGVLMFQIPPRQTISAYGEALPRFYQLVYTCSGALTVTVTAGIILNPTNLLAAGQYPNNFIAA